MGWQEFLDKIRGDKIWNKAKEIIKKEGLPMAISVIKTVSSTIVESITKSYLAEIL